MLVLRSPADARLVADAELRALVESRFAQVCAGEGHEPDVHGYFVVAEPGDTAEQLEGAVGFPVLRDAFGETRFGHPDFAPAAEAIEDHGGFHELTFVLTDDGYGVLLFVPKADGVDPELLAMCVAYATPVAEVNHR